MPRSTIGYIIGNGGQFSRTPFYRLRLPTPKCEELDSLLAKADGQHRRTTTLTASFHQADRLRVTEVDPPEYELRAAAQYVRGDVLRVQGKEGISCGLDISARFGIPLVREELRRAMTRAAEFVEFRVPSRNRDVIEFVADVDLREDEGKVFVAASTAAAVATLPTEDFTDWEVVDGADSAG